METILIIIIEVIRRIMRGNLKGALILFAALNFASPDARAGGATLDERNRVLVAETLSGVIALYRELGEKAEACAKLPDHGEKDPDCLVAYTTVNRLTKIITAAEKAAKEAEAKIIDEVINEVIEQDKRAKEQEKSAETKEEE